MAGRKVVRNRKLKKKPKNYEEIIQRGIELYSKGYSNSYVRSQIYKEFNFKYCYFDTLRKDIVKQIEKESDALGSVTRELNLTRLNSLLNDAIEQGDTQMSLKIIQEINKMTNQYEDKTEVKVDNTITFKIN
jgi:hypothetical protein